MVWLSYFSNVIVNRLSVPYPAAQESLRAIRDDCAQRAQQASLVLLESTVSVLEREHAKTRKASDLTGRFVDWFSSRGQVCAVNDPRQHTRWGTSFRSSVNVFRVASPNSLRFQV